MHIFPDQSYLDRLQEVLKSPARTGGTTHDFYHYPARFSPAIARCVLETFSTAGDWVLDPFMGGGTAIVEGLILGRRVIGLDVNSLGHFVSDVRTRPFSVADQRSIRRWARAVAASRPTDSPNFGGGDTTGIRNLPSGIQAFMSMALALAENLLPRRLAFARCALLRLGQWALDCRRCSPETRELGACLASLVEEMLDGLSDFVAQCRSAGISKRQIIRNRVLLHRNAAGLETDRRLSTVSSRPKLVFTSPPYPSVHVLYHRWQYRGRKETPAPYWIANVSDGCGPSLYNGGSRTPTGLRHYFTMITAAFRSIANFVAEDALIVQLIGFSDATVQLPEYLACMNAAGLSEQWAEPSQKDQRLMRRVPNRKWYAELQGQVDASTEYFLIHRLQRA